MHTIRTLARSPLFAFTAIAALALGIGANAAIYSAVNAILRNPLGLDDPGKVVAIRVRYGKHNMPSISTSAPDFGDIRASTQIFSKAATLTTADYAYTGGEMPERLIGAQVSWQWFDVFGVRPMLGRTFVSEEDVPENNRVVVLSHGSWDRLFGRDPAIAGKTIPLNDEPHTVAGVMGPGFRWPNQADFWIPIALPEERFTERFRHSQQYFTIARLADGVGFEQAAAYVDVITRRVVENSESDYSRISGWSIFATPFIDQIAGDIRPTLLTLTAAVGFVLLIACSNIAGLMLARVSGRAKEIAVRAALGAGRWRLIRHTLAESLVLAAIGGACGLALAYAGIRYLAVLAPQQLPYRLDVPIDINVLGFTLAVTVLSALLFAAMPAWQATRGTSFDVLKEGGRSGTAGKTRQRLRSALVVGEVALALVLLAGAGLLLRSLSQLQQVNPGFEPEGLMTASLTLPGNRYDTPEKRIAFHRALVGRLKAIPGVTTAAAISPMPFGGGDWSASFDIEGRQDPPGQPGPHGRIRFVSPDYFTAMGIRLIEGRMFTGHDRKGSEAVAIIDENLARTYWPNESPLGKAIRNDDDEPWYRIVGVVNHVKHSELAADSGKGHYYYPIYQQPVHISQYIVKTGGSPTALTAAIRQAVIAIDPVRPVHDLHTMDELIALSLGAPRFAVTLLGVFAALALGMAALGLYGVISYSVAQRTQEIGIRVALGARQSQVLSSVLARGMRLAAIGIALGLLGSLALSRLLESQLYETSALDPLTFAAVAAVLAAVALLASYLPARRAAKVDPVTALRYE